MSLNITNYNILSGLVTAIVVTGPLISSRTNGCEPEYPDPIVGKRKASNSTTYPPYGCKPVILYSRVEACKFIVPNTFP